MVMLSLPAKPGIYSWSDWHLPFHPYS